MSSFILVILMFSVTTTVLGYPYRGSFTRRPDCCQGRECKQDDERCPWGEHLDACNRLVCSKGPGARCGGTDTFKYIGVCGEGLMCKHDRCTGCSLISLSCDI